MAKIDDSVKKKVPELRFKGFTDDWEERKFSKLAEVRRGLTYKPSDVQKYGIRVLRSSNIAEDTFLIKSDDVFVNKEAVKIDKVKNGDILITSANGSSRLVGKHALIEGIENDTVHGGFMLVARAEKPEFVNAIMSSSWYSKFINIFVSGGNGAIGNLSKSDLEDQKVYVPSEIEQTKIGSFFKQLDDTIALHQRKLDLLKEQKKGYLQKMFPKNGAKVPELRFAGFADDWEERKLGEVIDIENGYAFKSEYFSDEEKRHIVLTPGSVKIGGGFQKDKGRYYDVSGVFPEKFIFKPGNIFITMTDLTPTAQSLGYPAIVPRDDNVYLHNQRLGKIINNTTNPEFLYTLLTTDTYHKEIVSSASGTTVKHSSVSKILDFKSAIPNIDEQKLIGSFFKELDNTIALHQRKLDLLKEQKKGFLQKMFV